MTSIRTMSYHSFGEMSHLNQLNISKASSISEATYPWALKSSYRDPKHLHYKKYLTQKDFFQKALAISTFDSPF